MSWSQRCMTTRGAKGVRRGIRCRRDGGSPAARQMRASIILHDRKGRTVSLLTERLHADTEKDRLASPPEQTTDAFDRYNKSVQMTTDRHHARVL
jgi:hypothetical protein